MTVVSAGQSASPVPRTPRLRSVAPLLAFATAVVAAAALRASAQDAPAEPPALRVPLNDLIIIRVQDRRLLFGSRMMFTGNDARPIDVPGLAGTTKVLYRPLRFVLDNVRDDDEAGTRVSLRLERRRTYFRLERTVSTRPATAAGFESVVESVTLSQGLSDDDIGGRARPGRVRLTVELRGEVAENVDGDDFAALRREHPRPFYKYLFPALRELGAEGVVTVDPWVARQALADPVPADRLPGVVAGLVRRLGDPSPKARERASLDLAALGPEGMSALQAVDRDGLSPQQSTAVDVLLKQHEPAPRVDTDRLREDVDFLCDCLYSPDRDVAAGALRRLGELAGRRVAVDPSATPAERFRQVEALRGDVAPVPPGPATKPAGG